MAGIIRMAPDEVRGIANQYRQQAENVNGVVTKMDSLVSQLQGVFEGQSCQAFVNRYAELKPGFAKTIELINEISTALDSAASAIENIDIDIASKF